MSLKDSITSPNLAVALGRRLAHRRLKRNITQKSLAHEAGVAMRTLRRLEAGRGASLDTFLRVAIALDLTGNLLAALPEQEIWPEERLQLRGKHRQRARARKPMSGKPKTPWNWDNAPIFDKAEAASR